MARSWEKAKPLVAGERDADEHAVRLEAAGSPNRGLSYSDPFGLCPECEDVGPPVPLPPGKNGQPNEWVNRGPARPGARDRWTPRHPVKTTSGGQPGASWDGRHKHWDVSDGQGTTRRYSPDGTEVDHDNKPVNQPSQPSPTPENPSLMDTFKQFFCNNTGPCVTLPSPSPVPAIGTTPALLPLFAIP